MLYQPKTRTYLLGTIFTLLTIPLTSFAAPPPTGDLGIGNLVAGFGSGAIAQSLMNQAPTGSEITIPTDTAQAIYLSYPNPLLGPLTEKLLNQLGQFGKDAGNDQISFLWGPNSTNDNKDIKSEPLKSVDINSVLQPLVYNDTQATQANNTITALSGALTPIHTINFNQLIASLGGNKADNLKAKLSEKDVQEYLSALRSYLATQTVALNNLYQLYAERQAIDANNAPEDLKEALSTVGNQIKGPVSRLKLENFMATRRITDQKWYKGLINDNPATLQRQQVELLAENLAESYQTRMTLERLLTTMSVMVLEFNQQIRNQLETKIQTLNNPTQQQYE